MLIIKKPSKYKFIEPIATRSIPSIQFIAFTIPTIQNEVKITDKCSLTIKFELSRPSILMSMFLMLIPKLQTQKVIKN